MTTLYTLKNPRFVTIVDVFMADGEPCLSVVQPGHEEAETIALAQFLSDYERKPACDSVPPKDIAGQAPATPGVTQAEVSDDEIARQAWRFANSNAEYPRQPWKDVDYYERCQYLDFGRRYHEIASGASRRNRKGEMIAGANVAWACHGSITVVLADDGGEMIYTLNVSLDSDKTSINAIQADEWDDARHKWDASGRPMS